MKTTYYILIFTCLFYSQCAKKPSENSNPVKENNDLSANDIHSDSLIGLQVDTLIFTWQSDMCFNTGYYLSKVYSEAEIKATHDLWKKSDTGLTSYTSVFQPKNIGEIDVPKFTDEYEEFIRFYNNCHPVDVVYWKNFISEQKKRTDKLYYLKKLNMEAYTRPEVLAGSQYAYEDCNGYVEALTTDDETLLKHTWEQWAKEASKTKGNPHYMDEFFEKYHSADWITYARIDLITFGWWNCVNKYIERADYAEMSEEFEKLFVRIERECEEP